MKTRKKNLTPHLLRITDIPQTLKKEEPVLARDTAVLTAPASVDISKRKKGLNSFWDKFKDSIIDLFKEEADTEMK